MKAVLVIDMPVNCRECPCFYDYLHCQAKMGLNVLGDERPKGCPLKPMPKRNEYRADTKYEDADKYDTGYADGWNDCLEEIDE